MSFENKYRVHEVAKDFGKQTKDITQILTTYATAPKNHMQVLSDKELSIVFEYMTQHNQVADMQASLATAPKGGENRGRNDRNDRNDRGGDRWIGDMLEIFRDGDVSFNYHAYHDGSFGLYEGGGLPSPAGRNDTLYQVLVEKLKKYTE